MENIQPVLLGKTLNAISCTSVYAGSRSALNSQLPPPIDDTTGGEDVTV